MVCNVCIQTGNVMDSQSDLQQKHKKNEKKPCHYWFNVCRIFVHYYNPSTDTHTHRENVWLDFSLRYCHYIYFCNHSISNALFTSPDIRKTFTSIWNAFGTQYSTFRIKNTILLLQFWFLCVTICDVRMFCMVFFFVFFSSFVWFAWFCGPSLLTMSLDSNVPWIVYTLLLNQICYNHH